MVIIFILSSIPVDLKNTEDKQGILYLKPEIQNLLHIPVFALLSFLWIMVYQIRGNSVKKSVLIALCITVFYCLVDEYHQYHVPGRFMSATDVVFDVMGAVLGGVVYFGISEAKEWK